MIQPTLTLARVDQLDQIAAFIAALQQQPESHIAYFGATVEEIAPYLSELTPTWHSVTVLATQDDRLVGLLTTEHDHTVSRAWLHGPLIDHEEWQTIADALYAYAVEHLIPPTLAMHELAGETANERLRQFADRQGFPPAPDSAAAMSITRSQAETLPQIDLPDVVPAQYSAFIDLHTLTFPRTYITAQQIIDKVDASNRILVVTADDQLQGYVYARLDESGQGYIDFIGVNEAARRRGIGRTLTIAACRWLLTFPDVQTISLTVNSQNSAAQALYKSLGFQIERSLQAYRKPITNSV
ncbi:MAG: GNAT family N-acetyltransferase [Anaerolineae bacterium]